METARGNSIVRSFPADRVFSILAMIASRGKHFLLMRSSRSVAAEFGRKSGFFEQRSEAFTATIDQIGRSRLVGEWNELLIEHSDRLEIEIDGSAKHEASSREMYSRFTFSSHVLLLLAQYGYRSRITDFRSDPIRYDPISRSERTHASSVRMSQE